MVLPEIGGLTLRAYVLRPNQHGRRIGGLVGQADATDTRCSVPKEGHLPYTYGSLVPSEPPSEPDREPRSEPTGEPGTVT